MRSEEQMSACIQVSRIATFHTLEDFILASNMKIDARCDKSPNA